MAFFHKYIRISMKNHILEKMFTSLLICLFIAKQGSFKTYSNAKIRASTTIRCKQQRILSFRGSL